MRELRGPGRGAPAALGPPTRAKDEAGLLGYLVTRVRDREGLPVA